MKGALHLKDCLNGEKVLLIVIVLHQLCACDTVVYPHGGAAAQKDRHKQRHTQEPCKHSIFHHRAPRTYAMPPNSCYGFRKIKRFGAPADRGIYSQYILLRSYCQDKGYFAE